MTGQPPEAAGLPARPAYLYPPVNEGDGTVVERRVRLGGRAQLHTVDVVAPDPGDGLVPHAFMAGAGGDGLCIRIMDLARPARHCGQRQHTVVHGCPDQQAARPSPGGSRVAPVGPGVGE